MMSLIRREVSCRAYVLSKFNEVRVVNKIRYLQKRLKFVDIITDTKYY